LALWGPLVGISVTSIVIALLLWRHLEATSSPGDRFYRAWSNDDNRTAEELAWKMVRRNPARLSWWIRFTDAHADVIDGGEGSSIGEPEIRQQVAKISDAQASAIESYFYAMRTHAGEPDPSKVLPLADASPPAQYANLVLAEGALEKKDWRAAAMRFEREGSSSSDVDETCLRRALRTRIGHDDWTAVRARINDPRWAAVADASFRLDLAVHDRDVLRVLLWVWPAGYVRTTAWPVALALMAGALWFWIATRLGRIHDGVQGRISLYALAFVLGVLSIYPTIILGTIEDELGFVEVGQHVPDFIYNVFGIGLREEACKAILFLPLLWILLRRGSRIEAMTCGALVGLGFAAEENIGYFEHGADAALSRFLSANFLHMALTALVALSMFDTLRKRATRYDASKVVFPVAVAVHGAYDFCLGVDDVPLSAVLSIVLLIVIAQRFLRQLLIASSREDERDVLNLFVGAMAAITGAAYIYGTTLVGPLEALRFIALGAASVAAVIVMFVRELSRG
jgi:RsiW-degrading membrane proteinase PrsW (M82 family)